MEERRRVLKLVEEGKITAEEALILLEQLEQVSEEKKKKVDEMVTALSTKIELEEAGEKEPTPVKWSSLKEKLFGFLDITVRKLKDFDLDFNFGPHYEVRHIFQQSSTPFQTIDIEIANGGVKVIPWDESEVRVECDARVYKVESQEAARHSFLRNAVFTLDNGHFRFLVPKQHLKVDTTIYIPEELYEDGNIRIFNGDVHITKLRMKKAHLKAVNGAITAEGCSGEKAQFETVNGAIKIKHSSINNLEVENINGLIDISGEYQKVNMQSFSGSIIGRLEEIEGGAILAKTVTGSVTLFLPEGIHLEGEFKSNIGGFLYDYPGITVINEKNETIQKWLRFQAHPDRNRTTHIYADTKTGSISLKMTGEAV